MRPTECPGCGASKWRTPADSDFYECVYCSRHVPKREDRRPRREVGAGNDEDIVYVRPVLGYCSTSTSCAVIDSRVLSMCTTSSSVGRW